MDAISWRDRDGKEARCERDQSEAGRVWHPRHNWRHCKSSFAFELVFLIFLACLTFLFEIFDYQNTKKIDIIHGFSFIWGYFQKVVKSTAVDRLTDTSKWAIGRKVFSPKFNFPDMGELTSRGLTVMEQEEGRYDTHSGKNFITCNLSLAWDNDSNFKSSAPRQHLVFKFPHHNFQHIRGNFVHPFSKYRPDKEINHHWRKTCSLRKDGWIPNRMDTWPATKTRRELMRRWGLPNQHILWTSMKMPKRTLYHHLLYILCKITKFSMLDKQSKKVVVILHFVVRFLIFWPWAFCIVGVSLSFFLSTFFLFLFFFFFSSFGEAYSSFLAFLCKNWMRKWNSVAACWKSFCRETEYN